ncbi:MAG: 50S ribosomal protein L32, partial [Myxococcales bacterium]|nr:50S ribosomal protein L32 [Myxococcales bacterium]
MITCSKCGRENEDQFKFCLGCGSNLEDQRAQSNAAPPALSNCPQCGTQVTPGQRFCGSCGFNVEAHAKIAAPVAVPAPVPAPAPAPVPSPPTLTPSQSEA